MKKRKMIQSNLIKNSIAAYMGAIELHNKPNFPYRYEIVSVLVINAWELALKAFVKKYCKKYSIFDEKGKSISLHKALDYVTENINSKKKGCFDAVRENIKLIEIYRNNVIHYYNDDLEPYIFTLIARAVLNYVDFLKQYLKKDVMCDDGLFILPLGFKLPFKPEDFLSGNVARYATTEEAKDFINSIIHTTTTLKENGNEDSVVLGFGIYLENVKKIQNSDILAAITGTDDADIKIVKLLSAKDLPEEEYRKVWKHTHKDLVEWCKNNVTSFKQNDNFNKAKKALGINNKYVYVRKLEKDNPKSASKKYYSDEALLKIKEFYES